MKRSLLNKSLGSEDLEMFNNLKEMINPDPEHFRITGVHKEDHQWIIDLTARKLPALCPYCGKLSNKLKSYVIRKIAGPIIGDIPVIYRVKVRKLVCSNENCSQKYFNEPLSFAGKYQRRTNAQNEKLVTSAARSSCLGTEKNSEIEGRFIGRNAIARQLNRKVLDSKKEITVVGIDDIASKKGHKYCTVIYSLDDGKCEPVKLLEGRKIEDVEEFLKEHPEIQIICRDGAKSYKSVCEKHLPKAIPIYDKFHLIDNCNKKTAELIKSLLPSLIPVDKAIINDLITTILKAEEQKELIKKSNKRDSDEPCKTKENYIKKLNSLSYTDSFTLKRKNLIEILCQHKQPRTVRQQALLAYCLLRYPELLKAYLFNFRVYRLLMKGNPEGLDKLIELYKDAKGPIKSFIKSIKADYKSILNAIKYKNLNSNGVEGYNNKIKLIKRDGFNKNKLSSLEKKIKIRHWADHHPKLRDRRTKKEKERQKLRAQEQEAALKDLALESIRSTSEKDIQEGNEQDDDQNKEDEEDEIFYGV